MKNISKFILLTTVIIAGGCAPGEGGMDLSSMGAGILGSTGLVSTSEAEGYIKAGSKVVKAASSLTDEQEYYLGRGVAATVFARYKALPNSSVNSYVNKVGVTLAAFSDKPETFAGYHFIVLDTDEVNAMAAPGGFIFVTKGFVKRMPDEDTLAAVLAHEISHVVKGHGVKAISQSNLTEALTLVGQQVAASQAGGGVTQELTQLFGDSIKDVTDTLLTKGYSRRQEYEADLGAAGLLQKAGYDPRALISMLEVLKKLEESEKGGWFSTHPVAKNRISELKDEFEFPDTISAGQAIRSARFKNAVKSLG